MSKTKIGDEQLSDEYYDLERRTEIKASSNRLRAYSSLLRPSIQ